MGYLKDNEKSMLFLALSREKEICKKLDEKPGKVQLVPIMEGLEEKFYYDKYEKEIREQVIDEFAEWVLYFVDGYYFSTKDEIIKAFKDEMEKQKKGA